MRFHDLPFIFRAIWIAFAASTLGMARPPRALTNPPLPAPGPVSVAPSSPPGAPNKVVYLEDAAAAFALKLRLTQEAHSTIDLVMSHLGADEQVGLPLLEALRAAALRGVKVRVVRSFYDTNYRSDTQDMAEKLLNDDALRTRPEVVTFGHWLTSPVPGPHARMWTTYDEKIFVVDGRYAILGGRGNSDEYLHWRDADLYLEGPVVTALQTVFERIWPYAVQDFGDTRADKYGPSLPERRRPPRATSALLESKLAEADALRASPGIVPYSIRVYHHNLIQTLHEHPTTFFDPMPDPILDRFDELAASSHRTLFYSLYPILDDRMRDALTPLARQGRQVELMTNSLETSRVLDDNPWPYDASVPAMAALADSGALVRQWVTTPEILFVHEKIAIFDDHVLFGSHNFNWSSSYCYDQADVDIESPELAETLAALFKSQADAHAPVASAAFLDGQRQRFGTGIAISDWFLGFY